MHHPPEILLFFGRFHVLLVHLPIGMLVALAAMEIAARFTRFKNANTSAGFLLALAAPLAVLTALCGWLLSLGGGYAENLLEWHERLGIATAAGCVLSAFLFWRGKIMAYRLTLSITVAVLLVTGHLGGSLTHGSDYLTRYVPRPLREMFGKTLQNPQSFVDTNNPAQQPVFAGVIAPLFQEKCVRCHGPEKSKGGLRLDSYARVKAGGEDGLVLNAEDPAQAELLRRIFLPLDDDDHMPPSGKSQLTAAEIALLKWWVKAGAPETNALAQLHPPQTIQAIIASRLQTN